ncbi:MAG: STAS domain-containing protein [Phycisphaerales bacterium]|nr:STAS domain-containing protein [Phycisphaerales bacterium]
MATDWSDSIVVCDLRDEPALSEELANAGTKLAAAKDEGKSPNVVLNFAEVTYLNSSNIAQLLRLRKLAAEGRTKLKLAGMSDQVWSVMLLTGLDKVFEFASDKATAIASLQIDAGASSR